MWPNDEASILMKFRKRQLKDDNDNGDEEERIQPASKKPQGQTALEPLSPSLTPHNRPSCAQPREGERSSGPPTPAEAQSRKRALETPESNTGLLDKRCRWFAQSARCSDYCADWLESNWGTQPETVAMEGFQMVPASMSQAQMDVDGHSQALGDVASQTQEELPPATSSAQSERQDPGNPFFRLALESRNIEIDYFGDDMPLEIHELVTRHGRKERDGSPRLGDGEKQQARTVLKQLWHKGEPMLSDIFYKTALFSPLFEDSGIAEGRDALWSRQPMNELPRSYGSYPLSSPKPDRHFGFLAPQGHDWEPWEKEILNHIRLRSYTQPTPDTVFPSYITEIKSEARKASLYAAENQLALSCAHRVISWHKLLNETNPSRKPSCTDAVVFGTALSQRQAVQYVAYWKPGPDKYLMSFIDQFALQKIEDLQRLRDYNKNLSEWLIQVQKPAVKQILKELRPIAKTWKKGRSASSAASGHTKSRRSSSTNAKRDECAVYGLDAVTNGCV